MIDAAPSRLVVSYRNPNGHALTTALGQKPWLVRDRSCKSGTIRPATRNETVADSLGQSLNLERAFDDVSASGYVRDRERVR